MAIRMVQLAIQAGAARKIFRVWNRFHISGEQADQGLLNRGLLGISYFTLEYNCRQIQFFAKAINMAFLKMSTFPRVVCLRMSIGNSFIDCSSISKFFLLVSVTCTYNNWYNLLYSTLIRSYNMLNSNTSQCNTYSLSI